MVSVSVLLLFLLMLLLERLRPARAFPTVQTWLLRAASVSGLQAALIIAFGASFDAWLEGHARSTLDREAVFWPAAGGYLAVTFVFYFWHRARHRSAFLFRWLHQFHHSPQRLEVITSFYKHPLEMLCNGFIASSVLYLGCGLNHTQAGVALFLCGAGELFYHWNVATPRWLGYLIQRPEMHCEHHREGVHAFNYGDLPIWDLLFGTFFNPPQFEGRCGMGDVEHHFAALLAGKRQP